MAKLTESDQSNGKDTSVCETTRDHCQPVDSLAGVLVVPADHKGRSQNSADAAENKDVLVDASAAHVNANAETHARCDYRVGLIFFRRIS